MGSRTFSIRNQPTLSANSKINSLVLSRARSRALQRGLHDSEPSRRLRSRTKHDVQVSRKSTGGNSVINVQDSPPLCKALERVRRARVPTAVLRIPAPNPVASETRSGGVVMTTRPTSWRAQTGTHGHAPVPRHAALRTAWRLSGGPAAATRPRSSPAPLDVVNVRGASCLSPVRYVTVWSGRGVDERGAAGALPGAAAGRRIPGPVPGTHCRPRAASWRAQTGTHGHAPVPRHAALRTAWRLSGGPAAATRPRSSPSPLDVVNVRGASCLSPVRYVTVCSCRGVDEHGSGRRVAGSGGRPTSPGSAPGTHRRPRAAASGWQPRNRNQAPASGKGGGGR